MPDSSAGNLAIEYVCVTVNHESVVVQEALPYICSASERLFVAKSEFGNKNALVTINDEASEVTDFAIRLLVAN